VTAGIRLHAGARRRLLVPRLTVTVLLVLSVVMAIWAFTGPAASPAGTVPLTPDAAVHSFLASYVAPDGRVIRKDQGSDTVSEGQAYAMLMAAAVGDRNHFMTVWDWTESHLLEPNGLLAWHWAGGRVVDAQPAADADVGTAAALVMASRRFGDPDLLAAGQNLAAAVVSHETAPSAYGRTLLAGPWAVTPTKYVDPSYLAPAELDELAAAFGAPWPALATSARSELLTLTSNGDLPPDWAVIASDQVVHPAAAPGSPGQPAVFGFDAVRAPIWMGTSCSASLRQAAAGLLPAFGRGAGKVELNLGGHPAPGVSSPLGLLGRAGAEWGAGRTNAAWSDLRRAARADQQHPTYYASAWVVITVLSFDHVLGPC
jgi:endoglucanase